MERTLADLAALTGGAVRGDPSVRVRGACGLEDAGPGDITFLAHPKYASLVERTKAGAIVVSDKAAAPSIPAIVVKDPNLAFIEIARQFAVASPAPEGVHPSAVIAPSAALGKNVSVGAHSVIDAGAAIGDGTTIHPLVHVGASVRIGRDSILYSGVSIRERCVLGDRVIVHCGTVIGSDGFGFATVDGVHHKIPQTGIVVIEDDVELGANCTVDRARTDKTVIKRGTKLDNLVHIGHNSIIGEHVLMAAMVAVAGSVKVEHHAMLGGQVAVGGHLTVGAGGILTGQAGLSKDLPPGAMYSGTPAGPHLGRMRALAASHQVDKLLQEVRELRRRVSELEKKPGP
ncbi:MAG TPA: UDP-3-O-(3-hydroxymyristoyl)glucosamine N-acyltransferase [Planctomycetota bacterium]|nr:UDP-3-O-(3-hydroxymyristoyl)glucosamine N-acyltransferase [Planctomycetota bacterium]